MNIRQLNEKREELGISYEMLSQMSGVSVSTIQKIFGGYTRTPRYNTLKALEEALTGTTYRPDTQSASVVKEDSSVYRYTSGNENIGRDQVMKARLSKYQKFGKAVMEALSYNTHDYPRQGEYTKADYMALPDDQRVELIDGIFYDMASPAHIHQVITSQIITQLNNCIEESGQPCLAIPAPSDVAIDNDDRTIVEPDVFIICKDDYDGPSDSGHIWGLGNHGVPRLIIEIISPSTRSKDMNIKFNKYRDAGVREYWIIDPKKEKIIVYLFDESQDVRIYGFNDTVPIGISDGHCQIDFQAMHGPLQLAHELFGDSMYDEQ